MRLLPAHYVKPYVGRSKTDRADAAALSEAARSSRIREVPIITLQQQQLQSLHRLRSQWMSTRQRYLSPLRGILCEFGIMIPLGASVAKAQIGLALAQADSDIPQGLQPALAEMLHEIARSRRTSSVSSANLPLSRERINGRSSCARFPVLAF